jgi:tetratricopeptide (TPR) repeat protein
MAFLFGKAGMDINQRLKQAEEAIDYALGKLEAPPAAAKRNIKKAGGKSGAIDFAIKECLDMASKDRDNLNIHLLLVKAFEAKGPEYFQGQITHFKRACEIAADTGKGKTALLASIEGQASNLSPGPMDYDEGLSNWYIRLGDLYLEAEKVDDAIAQYDKAVAQEPANPLPYEKLVSLLVKTNQKSTALSILKETKETIYYEKNPSFKETIDRILDSLQ